MTRRCTCSDHGDDTVFGPCYKCSPKPDDRPYIPRSPLVDPPRLIPSWAFTVPAEQPWETTLSDLSERGDD